MLLDLPPDQLEAPEQAPEAIMLDQPARRETLLLEPLLPLHACALVTWPPPHAATSPVRPPGHLPARGL